MKKVVDYLRETGRAIEADRVERGLEGSKLERRVNPTTIVTDEQKAEWKALAEKATPGPWRLAGTPAKPCPVISSPDRQGYQIHSMLHVKDDDPAVWRHMKDIYQNDAAYIVAACNALPALLADLETQARINAMQEAFAYNPDTPTPRREQYAGDAAALISADGERLATLREALGPFVGLAGTLGIPDDADEYLTVKFGNMIAPVDARSFVRARKALAALTETKGGTTDG